MEDDQLDRRAQRSRELLTAALVELFTRTTRDLISVRRHHFAPKSAARRSIRISTTKTICWRATFTHVLSQLYYQSAEAQLDLRLLPALDSIPPCTGVLQVV
ncbi:MAG: hypothetical protein U0559_17590 [Anaerolineae bacterium]